MNPEQEMMGSMPEVTDESLLRAAIRAGGGDRSEVIAKMARGLIEEMTDVDAAVKEVIGMMGVTTGKGKRVSTGGAHGEGGEVGVTQLSYNRNKGNTQWLKENRAEILNAMVEGRIK